MLELTDPQFAVRLLCIIISILVNSLLLIISIYQVLCKKNPAMNVCIVLLLLYLVFGIITPSYNVYYRFVIDESECFLSDTIEESLIVFTRLIIMFFYVSRLRASFKGSSYQVNDKLLIVLCVFILSYSVIIPLLWIPQQTVTPQITDKLGIYCSNTGDFAIICVYYGLDFVVSVILCLSFVRKLLMVRNKAGKRDTDTEINDGLAALAKKTLILTAISIVSSWIIVYPSMVLSSSDFLSQLRWLYPLDYSINGLCLFFMFKWKALDLCTTCYNLDLCTTETSVVGTKNIKDLENIEIHTANVETDNKNIIEINSNSPTYVTNTRHILSL